MAARQGCATLWCPAMGSQEGLPWLGCCVPYSKSLTLCSPLRQSMSSLSGPLQVVPDIDDQVANPENPQEVGFPSSLSMELLFRATVPSLSIMERDGSTVWSLSSGEGGEDPAVAAAL